METMSPHSFYKILMDLTTRLGLPEGFTEKYSEILPKKAKLKIACGTTWDVRVEKSKEEAGAYFFTTGWAEFCGDMALRMLEILVFSYVGDSTFHVSVYATTAFEKDSNFQVVKKNPSFYVVFKKYRRNKLYLPTGFVDACGLIEKNKVTLEYRGGESAEIVLNSYSLRNGYSANYFGLGWIKFWKANRLTVDKMYSFEFIPTNNVIRVEPVGEGDRTN